MRIGAEVDEGKYGRVRYRESSSAFLRFMPAHPSSGSPGQRKTPAGEAGVLRLVSLHSWQYSPRYLASCLASSACHLPSRLASGARHLPSRLARSAGRLAGGACFFTSRLADSARYLPSCLASSACGLTRGTSCRRHSFSPILFEAPSARSAVCFHRQRFTFCRLCLRTGQVNNSLMELTRHARAHAHDQAATVLHFVACPGQLRLGLAQTAVVVHSNTGRSSGECGAPQPSLAIRGNSKSPHRVTTLGGRESLLGLCALLLRHLQSCTSKQLRSPPTGAHLSNPRVLTRAETPASLESLGAAWKSDEASGFVMIVEPSAGLKGLEVAAAVANAESNNCKGKFASGRVSELVDSEVIFRGFSSCEDTNGVVTRQFFVVPRGQGGFVVFSVAGEGFGATVDGAQSDGLEGYQRAALTATGN